jgi:riboflavin biosynthesis pyrimidine reductase
MDVQLLHPAPRTVDAEHVLDDLGLSALAPPDRPYVIANMVASADGRTSVDGESAPLSSPADRLLFHALRGQVDAVLAGTVTLRAERYRRLVRDPGRRAARAARGLHPDPLALILSRSGDIPYDIELLTDPEQPRAIFTAAEADPVAALRRVREEHGVLSLLCEGGATLLAGLVYAGLVDELFLSVSPYLVGGTGPAILAGPPLHPPVTLDLVHLIEHEHVLFLRYRIGMGRG